jgi:hypothetical protein
MTVFSGWRPAVVAAAMVLALLPAPANAEPTTVTADKPQGDRHTVYIDLLGKNGFWGVGYDVLFKKWMGAGVTGSFWEADGEQIWSLSPYVVFLPAAGQRHRWFVHVGPQLVHTRIISPVPEWPGASSTGIGMELSSGYEYRNHVVLRVYAMGAAGKGGATPWVGASVGWSL